MDPDPVPIDRVRISYEQIGSESGVFSRESDSDTGFFHKGSDLDSVNVNPDPQFTSLGKLNSEKIKNIEKNINLKI